MIYKIRHSRPIVINKILKIKAVHKKVEVLQLKLDQNISF